MKKCFFNRFILISAFLIFLYSPLLPFSPQVFEEESPEGFIICLEKHLNSHDLASYLLAFSPEIREKEKLTISSFFAQFQMEKVSLSKAYKEVKSPNVVILFLRALFENSYSVIIESWQLELHRDGNGWKIMEKRVIGGFSTLYKIKIPSERVERVKLIEIDHVDIKLSFRDALLFYDNLPGLETALLVIGKGYLYFSPSDAREKHQLELLYRKNFLEDSLEYAFLRVSNSFFHRQIKISPGASEPIPPLPQTEINKAYSLFTKHYPNSFTIENSLTGELVSFLPQGDEAVFEFKGKKTGELTYIYYPFSDEEVTLADRRQDKFISRYSPETQEGKKKLFITFGEKFDVESYEIDVDFNPENSFLSAKAKIEISPLVDNLDALKFKLSTELEILRIFDEKGRELFYNQDKLRKFLYIYFLYPLSSRASHYIEIYYRGKIEPPPFISDVISSPQYEDTVIIVPIKYDTYLFSQSAYWYPLPPEEDYFTSRLKVIVPPQYSCISNGELLMQGKVDGLSEVLNIEKLGHSFFVFETKNPVKYLSFIVGKFTKLHEDREPFPIEIFASSDFPFQRKGILEEAKSIINFYETCFGSFPFEKLHIVYRLWLSTGGHSPASFIVLNELPRARNGRNQANVDNPVDLSRWKEYYLAHEIAHQWWGQGVSWGSYHDQWLSEGLAQFSAVLYLKNKYEERAFSSILKKFSSWTERKAKWGPVTLGARLSYFDFEAYQTIIYNKPTLVLNMLLEIVGEEKFFEGLREFYRSFKYSAARTGDFIRAMEKASGRSLGDFFKPWLNSHFLPEVKVSHQILKKEEGYILKVQIVQAKELFTFPLTLEWRESGRKVIQKVVIDNWMESFEFPAPTKPEKVRANSDNAVPGKFS